MKRIFNHLLILISIIFFFSSYAEENIITIYVYHSGMSATLGYSSSDKPVLYLPLDNATEPTLLLESPSLTNKDSFAKFFRTFVDKYVPKIKDVFMTEARSQYPIKVYIAANNIWKLKMNTCALREQGKLSPEDAAKLAGKIYEASETLKFHVSSLLQALKVHFPNTQHEATVEDDASLIYEMARQFSKETDLLQEENSQVPANRKKYDSFVMMHATTALFPFVVSENEELPVNMILLSNGAHCGCGVCSLGSALSKSCQFIQEMSPIHSPQEFYQNMIGAEQADLINAILTDQTLQHLQKHQTSNEPNFEEKAYKITELFDVKGYDVLGDKVQDVALNTLPEQWGRTVSTFHPYSKEKAHQEACKLMDDIYVTTFLETLLKYRYLLRHINNKRILNNELVWISVPYSTLVIGEKAGVLPKYAEVKGKSVQSLLKDKLNDPAFMQYMQKKYNRLQNKDKDFEEQLKSTGCQIIDHLTFISDDQFPHYMHRAALKRLSLQ